MQLSSEIIYHILGFPYEPLAGALRSLSLSGQAGNIIALLLYSMLCLLPVLWGAWLWLRKGFKPELLLLALCSIVLAIGFYRMINPQTLPEPQQVYQLLYSITADSILGAYVLIRMLRRIARADMHHLQAYLLWALRGLNLIFMIEIAVTAYRIINGLMAEHAIGLSMICLGLEQLLAYGLDIWVCLAAQRLLRARMEAPYSAKAMENAKSLAKLGACALALILLSGVLVNVLQLLFAPLLQDIQSAAQFPLFSFIFVLLAFACSKLLQENKELKDSNDLFI